MTTSDLQPVKHILASAFILTIPRMFYRGLILYFSWSWFITPFVHLPELPYLAAVGITALISLLTFEHIGEVHAKGTAFTKMIEWVMAASVPFFFMFLIHFFIIICNCRIYTA